MTGYEINQAVARIHASVASVDWTKYRAGGVPAWELAENEEFFTKWAKAQAEGK